MNRSFAMTSRKWITFVAATVAAGFALGMAWGALATNPKMSGSTAQVTTSISRAPEIPCAVPGHPKAVCVWFDPEGQECSLGGSGAPSWPAFHGFGGDTSWCSIDSGILYYTSGAIR